MADFDRYLAACEDRDADRRLSDEDMDRESRMNDLYAKHAGDVDKLMEGINPDTGRKMRFDDEGHQIQCAGCPDTDVRYFHGVPLCKCCAAETPFVCGECGGIDHATSHNGPTTCLDCRAVECHKSVDWDADDPEMADDDDRESRLDRLMSAAEARFDEDRDREMEDR